MPQEGGHLSELKELLNIDQDGWILAVNWLLFSFYPKYPHPNFGVLWRAGNWEKLHSKAAEVINRSG
jgi:hypothetical protein